MTFHHLEESRESVKTTELNMAWKAISKKERIANLIVQARATPKVEK